MKGLDGGMTSIHGHQEMAELLLAHGANINIQAKVRSFLSFIVIRLVLLLLLSDQYELMSH